MVRAYVLVKAEAGDAEALVGPITDLETIVEAHVVAGEYDVIVEVDAEDVADIMHTAAAEIRDIRGVADTKTYISLD